MDLITFREPDIVYICDTVECGSGGFVSNGRAWTYQKPPELRTKVQLNIQEYIAQIVAIWIDITEKRTNREDYMSAIDDSSTSAMC